MIRRTLEWPPLLLYKAQLLYYASAPKLPDLHLLLCLSLAISPSLSQAGHTELLWLLELFVGSESLNNPPFPEFSVGPRSTVSKVRCQKFLDV